MDLCPVNSGRAFRLISASQTWISVCSSKSRWIGNAVKVLCNQSLKTSPSRTVLQLPIRSRNRCTYIYLSQLQAHLIWFAEWTIFLLAAYVLNEGVTYSARFSPPMSAFVPVFHDTKRLFTILDWGVVCEVEKAGGEHGAALRLHSPSRIWAFGPSVFLGFYTPCTFQGPSKDIITITPPVSSRISLIRWLLAINKH